MSRTNGVIEARPRVIGGRPTADHSLRDDEGGLEAQPAVSVVVAHEDSMPRDIIARACAQRHNLTVVGCMGTGGEIMTSCLPTPPRVIVTSDSISGQFDEIIDALLAVGTRVI